MAVEATTTCKRVVGPVVAAALMIGAVGVVPARAAETAGTSDPRPVDYAAQAGRAANYIDSHSADLMKGDLGPQLDGALALDRKSTRLNSSHVH